MTGSRSVPPKNSSFSSTPSPRAAQGSRARNRSPTSWQAIPRRSGLRSAQAGPGRFRHGIFYGVNAFRFINREGTSRHGRYRIRPEAGEEHLDADEATRQPGSYLFDELAERLSRGSARFRLLVQLAGEGDPVADGSLPWPEERPQVELGTIAVTSRVADSTASERRLLFDPARLVDGIELSDDPLPLARSALYAIAYRRRNA